MGMQRGQKPVRAVKFCLDAAALRIIGSQSFGNGQTRAAGTLLLPAIPFPWWPHAFNLLFMVSEGLHRMVAHLQSDVVISRDPRPFDFQHRPRRKLAPGLVPR